MYSPKWLTILTTAAFLSVASFTAHAASFTVTKTADTADGTCDADCSLREAVIAANAAGGTNDITLPAGTYVLDLVGACENSAATGDLDIVNGGLGTDITINGSTTGGSIIDGNGTDRVFHLPPITSASSLTLNNVTVTGGDAQDCGTGTDIGGGIRLEMGSLVLDNSTVTVNNAPASAGGGGGGISESSFASSITVIESTISNNTTGGTGGGMGLNSASVTMVNSTVSGNDANGSGGGISLFDNTVRLRNVTITDNTADADGGNNGDGGGVAVVGTSGTLIPRNTIIAGNNDASTGAAAAPVINPDCSIFGTFTSEGYNIIGDNRGCIFTASTGDQVGDVAGGSSAINALLAGLANNGGITRTHALQPGSPAIDMANNVEGCTSDDAQTTVLTNDQRQFGRPFDGDADGDIRCDVGAFELGGCGDGIVDAGEECDNGSANSDTDPDACRTTCVNPSCGDGVVDAGEGCDDGNNVDGDGCEANCALISCGDGTVDAGEECDDGTANSDTTADACRTTCVNPTCGDGVADAGEECDDGNATEGDGCSANCTNDNLIFILGDGGCSLNARAGLPVRNAAGVMLLLGTLGMLLASRSRKT